MRNSCLDGLSLVLEVHEYEALNTIRGQFSEAEVMGHSGLEIRGDFPHFQMWHYFTSSHHSFYLGVWAAYKRQGGEWWDRWTLAMSMNSLRQYLMV